MTDGIPALTVKWHLLRGKLGLFLLYGKHLNRQLQLEFEKTHS